MTPKRLEELTILANSDSFYDRKSVATARDLPLELQEILARDKYNSVRCRLARNPSVTNIKLQEILARDEDWTVRWGLVKNPSCTDRKLWELLRNDEDEDVREEINQRINQEKDKIKLEFKNKICGNI